jgi:L-threonylcarbamoyladenylate synthase
MIVVPAKTDAERKRALRLAVSVLRQGGVIAYPTETVYGFGCDPRNVKALARIFRIKGREKGKPVLLVASSLAQAKRVAQIRGVAATLAKTHWPGPLTLVLPSLEKIMGRTDVAIRVSSDPLVQELSRQFRFPVVSTSANRSGEPAARSAKAIVQIFGEGKIAPDLVIDAGTLPKREASTIVRIGDDGKMELLRAGAIRL